MKLWGRLGACHPDLQRDWVLHCDRHIATAAHIFVFLSTSLLMGTKLRRMMIF